NGPRRPLCSLVPVATPPCRQIQEIARSALRAHARLLAYQRPAPIIVRGDEDRWPAGWAHDLEEHTLTPTTPGTGFAHIAVSSPQRYGLWLDGTFSRGLEVSVDGERVGQAKNDLALFSNYVHVGNLFLTPGVHTVALTYPHADLGPGSGLGGFTSL